MTCTALIACLGAADAAWACNEPYIAVSTKSAGPRDTVAWTVANLEPRAKWVVSAAGRTLASGTAGTAAPTGTYVMPNHGDRELPIEFSLAVTHDEPSQTHEGSYERPTGNPAVVAYRPPVSTPKQTDPPPAAVLPPGPSPPATGFAPAEPQKKQEPQGNRPDPGPPTDPPNGLDPSPATPGPVPAEPAAESRSGARSAIALLAEPRADDRAAVTAHPLRVETREPLALPGPQPARRMPVVRATGRVLPRAVSARDPNERLPAVVLIGAGILGLGAALATARWARPRRGPTPGETFTDPGPRPTQPSTQPHAGDLVIEAELQELIAEERAREVSRDAEPVSSDSV